MKHTIASLTCLVENLQGQVRYLEGQMAIVQRRSIYAANRAREQDNQPRRLSRPANYATLPEAAQKKIDEALARVNQLREKRNSNTIMQ